MASAENFNNPDDRNEASWNDTVPTSAIVYDRVSSYSGILLSSEDDVMLNGIQESCSQIHVASIYTRNGWPFSYLYHSECENTPPQAAHFPVKIIERFRLPEFKEGMELMWLQLNQLAQDKLYVLLATGIAIWRSVYYDDSGNGWVRRSEPPAADAVHQNLKYYVHRLPGDAQSVLDHLKRGRTQVEMQRCVENIVSGGLMHHRLDTAWVAALISGVTSETGRSAVYKLLEGIATLVPGLEIAEGLPAVGILPGTSVASDDSSSFSSSGLSSSSNSCSSPDAKRKRADNPDVKRVTCHHHCDMYVITRDPVSGVSNYLFLVAIHSAGKTFNEANQKFLLDMISVLEGQSQVFGLLFSNLTVLLYSARKEDDGEIIISKEEYRFLEGHRNLKYDFFCVPHFQKLIMDIFSCIIHSLKNVEA